MVRVNHFEVGTFKLRSNFYSSRMSRNYVDKSLSSYLSSLASYDDSSCSSNTVHLSLPSGLFQMQFSLCNDPLSPQPQLLSNLNCYSFLSSSIYSFQRISSLSPLPTFSRSGALGCVISGFFPLLQ